MLIFLYNISVTYRNSPHEVIDTVMTKLDLLSPEPTPVSAAHHSKQEQALPLDPCAQLQHIAATRKTIPSIILLNRVSL